MCVTIVDSEVAKFILEALKQESSTAPRVDVYVIAGDGTGTCCYEKILYFQNAVTWKKRAYTRNLFINQKDKNMYGVRVQVLLLHGGAIRSVLLRWMLPR